MLVTVLKKEVSDFLGRHRYERGKAFRGYRNMVETIDIVCQDYTNIETILVANESADLRVIWGYSPYS